MENSKYTLRGIEKLKKIYRKLYELDKPLLTFSVGRLVDIASTAFTVNKYGAEIEMNLRIRNAMMEYGVIEGLIRAEAESLLYLSPLLGYHLIKMYMKKSGEGELHSKRFIEFWGMFSMSVAVLNVSWFLYMECGFSSIPLSLLLSTPLFPLWAGWIKREREKMKKLQSFFRKKQELG